MAEESTFLKSLADKLTDWDKDLAKFMGRASEVAGDKKDQFDKVANDVKQQAAQLKGKVDEYRGKSKEEIKSDAEDFMRQTSGKIAEGLRMLSDFFEAKASGGSAASGQPEDASSGGEAPPASP